MSILYIVIPLALLFAIAAVVGFTMAVRGGQLDDLKTPALRILHDDVPLRRGAGARLSDKSADAAPKV